MSKVPSSNSRVLLAEVVLSHKGSTAPIELRVAGDRGVVVLGDVISSLSRSEAVRQQRRAAAKTVPLSSTSPAKTWHRRWSQPACESSRRKRSATHRRNNELANTIILVDGVRAQDPKDGYLLSDIAQYLNKSITDVRRMAKAFRCLTRIQNTRFYEPLTRAQAKLLIMAFRVPRSERAYLISLD
jgi:hypothetical protein